MEDEKIIGLFWNCSEQALQETDQKYGAMCRKIAGNILSDRQDAEECVNDAYLQLWDTIPPHRPKNFPAFLGTVVRNLSLDRYRYNSRQKRGGGQIQLLLSELSDCISGGSRTEQVIDDLHFAETMNAFLEKLPALHRMIFVRRYWYADSVRTIAKLGGLRESTVRASLSRSRKKLRKALEKGGIIFECLGGFDPNGSD